MTSKRVGSLRLYLGGVFSRSDFTSALVALTGLDITTKCSLKKRERKKKLHEKSKGPVSVCPKRLCSGLALPCPRLRVVWWAPTTAHTASIALSTRLHSPLITEIHKYWKALQGSVFLIFSGLESLFGLTIQEGEHGSDFPFKGRAPLLCPLWHAEFQVPLYSSH